MVDSSTQLAPSLIIWTLRIGGILLIGFFAGAKYLPRNRLGGIRFCYTLADDEVWRRVHLKFRWAFLILGLMCFYPLRSLNDLMTFTILFGIFVIVMVIASYLYARKLYREKFGTTKVISRGLFKYEPPVSAEGNESKWED